MARSRRQHNFFLCGHRGFGRWCHRCKAALIAESDQYIRPGPLPDLGRFVKGHGRPRAKIAGTLA